MATPSGGLQTATVLGIVPAAQPPAVGGFAGYVSGSVATSSVGASIGFQFDTRDGSWAVSAAFSYTSELLTASVMFMAASKCTKVGRRKVADSASLNVHIYNMVVITRMIPLTGR